MSTLSSADAAATSSSPALNAPRFQFLRSLTHTIVESNSLASERTAGPQPAAGRSPQAAQDINVSFPRPQEPAIDPSPTASPVASKAPVTTAAVRSERIPFMRRTIYVFPDASNSISKAHHDRFPALTNIFMRNIEDTPKLSDVTGSISYQLLFCGPCLVDAIPSIVVFCPLMKLKKLKSLLTQNHIRSQFEPETATPNSVRFGLFFWGQSIDKLAVHEVTLVIPETEVTGNVVGDVTAGHAPWGLHITDSDSGDKFTATMSCIIQVAGVRFGLTTAHAFRHPSATSPKTGNVDSDDSDTDDDEYDTAMERGDHGKAKMDLHTSSPFNGRGKEVRLGKIQAHIPPHEDTSAWVQGHADLDWALLDLGLEKARVPTSATAAKELHIANHLPGQCLDVLIITRAQLEVPATLYNIPSYVGGVKGSPAAEVWTVGCAPDNNQTNADFLSAIRKGDSGSIVIGAQSGELYGMVMAANPFGDIHIIPFTAMLEQVKEFFATRDVSVLNLPRGFSPSTARSGVEVNKMAKEQNKSKSSHSISPRSKSRGNGMLNQFIYNTTHVSEFQFQGSPKKDERRQKIMGHLDKFDQQFGVQSSQSGHQ